MEVKSAQNTTQPTQAGGTPSQTPPPAPSPEATLNPAVVPPVEGAAPAAPEAKETPEAAPQPEKFPKQFAAIVKREKAVTEREKALKAAEPDLKVTKQVQELAKAGKRLEAIKLLGFSYEDLTTEALAASESSDPQAQIKALQDKIDQLEGKKKDEEKAPEAAQIEQAKQVVEQFKTDIKTHVDAAKDKYPLIVDNGYHDLVFQVIDEHHAREGVLLTIEQAAQAVENYIEQNGKKLLTHPKFAPKPPATEDTGAPKQDDKKPAPTLTNQDAPANTKQDLTRLSESARVKAVASKYDFFKS